MQSNFPMTSVPNLQGYPETGYPVAAYYGVDTTLAQVNSMNGSSGSSGNGSLVQQLDPGSKFRTLAVVLLAVVGAYALWHFYMK